MISLRNKLLDRFLNVGKLPIINFVQGSFPVVNQIHHSPDKTCKLPCPRRRYQIVGKPFLGKIKHSFSEPERALVRVRNDGGGRIFLPLFYLTDFAVTTECILRLPAHSTRRLLTLEFPAFVIAVCRTLFPLESSPGQSPIKLTKDFAFEKREKSPISATIEIAPDITDSRGAHQSINFFPSSLQSSRIFASIL